MQATEPKQVLVPLAVDKAYDYLAPAGTQAGALVAVEFGGRRLHGVVWGEAAGGVARAKLKTARALDLPRLAAPQRRFLDWMAGYVMAPRGTVLRQALNVPSLFRPPRAPSARERMYRLGKVPQRASKMQARLLEVLQRGEMRGEALLREADVSAEVLRRAVQSGYVCESAPRDITPDEAAPPALTPPPSPLKFSPEQTTAARALVAAVQKKNYATHLLDGVTGSGKTEVYFEALAEVIAQSGQAVVLLPEIALTAQFFDRFRARFGAPPAVWHSGLGAAARRAVWLGVAQQRIPIVVGARSALFLPYQNLRALVVDEEHDTGFKQEQKLLYHARDMAVAYGAQAQALVVLSSATLSLESVQNHRRGRYERHVLRERVGAAQLPTVTRLDMREHPPERGEFLSPVLVDAMRATLARGEQVLLFLNRRGYAPLTLCRACGHRCSCPQCDAWLVQHRTGAQQGLLCHHCGHRTPLPTRCAACDAEDTMTACGPGVERVAAEVEEHFRGAMPRLITLSSDSGHDFAALQNIMARIAAGEADIIVGTQILAKGHHFPNLTLVGVVDADLGLSLSEPRAAERSWQILHQVAGRAGRATRAGQAILQSYQPEHPVLEALAAQDKEKFLDNELQARKLAGMPPFGALAALILSDPNEERLTKAARAFSAARPHASAIEVLGPAPAPFYRLRGQYRLRFLLMSANRGTLQPYIAAWQKAVRLPASVRLAIDIDPQSFF